MPEAAKIKAIFLAVQDLASSGERIAYLDGACADDAILRQRVEALLQAHERPDRLLDRPAAEHIGAEPDNTPLPNDLLKPDSLDRLGYRDALEAVGRMVIGAEPSTWPTIPGHEILSQLGAGGMGVVYKARDQNRNAIVALKTLPHYGAAELYRFKQEFRSLANLNHPNLIMLYQMLSEGEHWCFTMELIEGQDFLSGLHLNPLPNGIGINDPGVDPASSESMPTVDRRAIEPHQAPARAVDIGVPIGDEDRLRDRLRQLCEGLTFLHAQDRLHCDLKPSNVMVDHDGRVVILDFGLVRETTPPSAKDAAAPSLSKPEPTTDLHLAWTREGAIRGTIG